MDFSSKEELEKCLLEMFPELTKKQAHGLLKSGDDVNVIITRILDNNIESPTYDLKDLVRHNRTECMRLTTYNYPEIFEHMLLPSDSADVKQLREEASKLTEESVSLVKNAINHEIKSARIFYSIEAQEKREKASELNREAALAVMRMAALSSGPIDLHGLTVNEATGFMEDLLKFRKFKEITVVTGQIHKSSRLRPAIVAWFHSHGFVTSDRGPSLYAIKDPFK